MTTLRMEKGYKIRLLDVLIFGIRVVAHSPISPYLQFRNAERMRISNPH
jgi:hypothetical protein